MKILFLGANGIDTSRLQIAKEFSDVQAEIERARASHKIEFRVELAVTPVDLNRLLLDYAPDIVHFSGHGTVLSVEAPLPSSSTREFELSDESFAADSDKQGAILLERDDGHSVHVSTKALARLFAILKTQRCVVLNACFSATQVDAIAEYVDCVIGMKRAIEDQSAIVFAIGFYQAIVRGHSVKSAFELGCSLIFTSGLVGADVPELRGFADPEDVKFTGTTMAQRQSKAFHVSDVQVIPNRDDGTCTLDFRVWNAGDVDVLINRVLLRVIDVWTDCVLVELEMSKEYHVEISGLVQAGDVISCNVSQLVPSRSFDRFGIRLNDSESRNWKLHTSLLTNIGMIEGQIVEFSLPCQSESSYNAQKTSEARNVAVLPECLIPYVAAMRGSKTELGPIRDILEHTFPDPIARSLTLFEWFGRGGGSVPELLLLEVPTPVLIDALTNEELTLIHIRGAITYFSGGHFTAKKLGDRGLLTDKIKEMFIQYSIVAGYDRGERFAVECAIGRSIPEGQTNSALSIFEPNSSLAAAVCITAPLKTRSRVHREIAVIQFKRDSSRSPGKALRKKKWLLMGLLVAIVAGLLLVRLLSEMLLSDSLW